MVDYAVVRYGAPDDTVVDLIGRLGERFDFEDLTIEDKELEGISIHVVTPKCLYRLKKDSLRPQDSADCQALLEKFDFERLEN